MKRLVLIILTVVLFASCAPVLREEVMKNAILDLNLPDSVENPSLYTGKTFVLGGMIVSTKLTEKGSLIEALYIPVDSRGYLKEAELSQWRFLALYPKNRGLLDPLIYRQRKEITLAGEFIGTQHGKIDDMEYTYPVFEIKELYIWEERAYYAPGFVPYYYPYYYPYGWYEPWWRPYYAPYPYWHWY